MRHVTFISNGMLTFGVTTIGIDRSGLWSFQKIEGRRPDGFIDVINPKHIEKADIETEPPGPDLSKRHVLFKAMVPSGHIGSVPSHPVSAVSAAPLIPGTMWMMSVWMRMDHAPHYKSSLQMLQSYVHAPPISAPNKSIEVRLRLGIFKSHAAATPPLPMPLG